MKQIITILFLIYSFVLKAQPLGDYECGLIIQNIYTPQLKKIKQNDKKLKIRYFVITDTSYKSKVCKEIFKKNPYPIGVYGDLNSNTSERQNERMVIVYKKDTMIIDFYDIIKQIPIGYDRNIDSLVIMKGYYRYYNEPNDCSNFLNNDENYYRYVNFGITPFTLKYLSSITFTICPEKQEPLSWEKMKKKGFVAENYKKWRETWVQIKVLSYENEIDINLIK